MRDSSDDRLSRQVKVLFVRKLATPVTEELLEKTFSQFGKLERVKKLKDYAFVHFEERDAAVKVQHLNQCFLSSREWKCAEPHNKYFIIFNHTLYMQICDQNIT